MALNLTGGVTAFETMIDNFAKTVSREAVTEAYNNVTGAEELTYGTGANITGAFYRRGENWDFEKKGLFEKADAIMLVKNAVTINKNDRLTYAGAKYLVNTVVQRSLNGNNFYKTVELFLA